MNNSAKRMLSIEEKEILDNYLVNKFPAYPTDESDIIPDDIYLQPWPQMIREAAVDGAGVINRYICPKRPVDFVCPSGISISMHEACAGSIALIHLKDTADFENLITNLVHKGIRPSDISSIGASYVFGKKTRMIILSDKPYSNVPASELRIDESIWHDRSYIIRLEHECTHFYTQKYYGHASGHLHDELIADFMGIYEAFGYYKAEYFLRFIGAIPGSGNRMNAYIPNISDDLKAVLTDIITAAAMHLEAWSHSDEFASMTKKRADQ